MEIITFGTGERQRLAASLLSHNAELGEGVRIVLLPIPSTRDNRNITSTDLPLEEVLAVTDQGSLVCGYGIPKELCDSITLRGGRVLDLSLDEEFLVENAEITARGTLGHILTHSRWDTVDLRVAIIGYGRIGRCLLRLLLFMGADVCVYTTREEVVCELCESSVDCRLVGCESDFCGYDFIINTAPARLIPNNCLLQAQKETKIIDLASGNIYKDRERVEKLSSVPQVFYPHTAGKLYAKYVKRALFTEGDL